MFMRPSNDNFYDEAQFVSSARESHYRIAFQERVLHEMYLKVMLHVDFVFTQRPACAIFSGYRKPLIVK